MSPVPVCPVPGILVEAPNAISFVCKIADALSRRLRASAK